MTRYIVMEKLDQLTPWHTLRGYETEQEARWYAFQWSKQAREAGYPKYDVMPVREH